MRFTGNSGDDGEAVLLKHVPTGFLALPTKSVQVDATGTTATDLVGFT